MDAVKLMAISRMVRDKNHRASAQICLEYILEALRKIPKKRPVGFQVPQIDELSMLDIVGLLDDEIFEFKRQYGQNAHAATFSDEYVVTLVWALLQRLAGALFSYLDVASETSTSG